MFLMFGQVNFLSEIFNNIMYVCTKRNSVGGGGEIVHCHAPMHVHFSPKNLRFRSVLTEAMKEAFSPKRTPVTGPV